MYPIPTNPVQRNKMSKPDQPFVFTLDLENQFIGPLLITKILITPYFPSNSSANPMGTKICNG